MSRVVVGAIFSVLLTGGCEVAKPQQGKSAPVASTGAVRAAAPVVVAPVTRPAEPVVVVEEPGSTPGSLANDAAAYARAMERQLEERGRGKGGKAQEVLGARVRSGGDEIQWLDAREIRLTLEPGVQPVHAVQMNSAQSGVLTPSFHDVAVGTLPPRTAAPAATQPVVEAQRVVAPSASSDELESNLAREVKRNPRDVIAHLDYQLFQFLQGQAVPQMGAIGTLSAEDREVVAAVMDALTNFRTNAKSGDAGMGGRRVRPLVELSERLRAANLNVPTAVLCTRVDGFGIYEPTEGKFAAGRESRVILYCEIENFASQLNAKNQWETRLTLETTLYDARGNRVAVEERRPVVDLSRNRRRDFFARGFIRVPALAAGQYSLTVTVTDAQANRMAEARVPVELVGQ